MQLTVINSGSTGNGYVLQNGTEALVIECGVPRQDCLAALGWTTKKVVGCIITHEHGDHAKYVEKYAPLMPVYASNGTICALHSKWNITPLEPLRTVQLGNFSVRPIPAEHDASEPFAYIIDHPEIGRLLFATDTYYLRYRIPKMTYLLVECNYSKPILNDNIDAGVVPAALKERLMNSHMSLEHLKDMLNANDLTAVRQIVLIHLSANNSNAGAFCREIMALTGKPTTHARKWLRIEINHE